MAVIAAGLPIAAISIFSAISRASYKCDPEGQAESNSPDGTWHATSKVVGCHGLLMFTDFVSTAIVRKTSAAPGKDSQIFVSDSPDGVAFDWPASNQLRITVPSITTVLTSEKKFEDLEISYVVPADVLKNARNIGSALKQDSALNGGRLAPSDQKLLERTDADSTAYADRFVSWARRYTSPPGDSRPKDTTLP